MKEAYLYKKLKDKKVQCQTCAHYCLLDINQRGKCGVRENIGGKLFSLNYRKSMAFHIDPIEKKPFFHFLPGTHSLSLAAAGCNFSCLNCQNYAISQEPKGLKEIPGQDLSPQDIVESALKENLSSISYTYSEPAIFLEYALDTMKIARERGLRNAWVTNGFLSPEALDLISPYLDAANVDLKSFSDDFYQKNCGARLQPVLDILKSMKEKGIWIEITTLVIPTLSDDLQMLRDMADFIEGQLGSKTPWHITKFSGEISWKLQDLPDTPVETLEKAYEIGKEMDLKYVYTGNIPGSLHENTYCSYCNSLMIKRLGYFVERYDRNGKCSKCGGGLNIID